MSTQSSIITQLQNFYNSNINNLNITFDQHPNLDYANQQGEAFNLGVRGLPEQITNYSNTGDFTSLQKYLDSHYLSQAGINQAQKDISIFNAAATSGDGTGYINNFKLNPSNFINISPPSVPRTVNPSVSSPVVNSLTSALSSITSNSAVKSVNSTLSGISPIFLIGGVVVLFLLLRK